MNKKVDFTRLKNYPLSTKMRRLIKTTFIENPEKLRVWSSYSFCHGKTLSREPCFREKFYCKILFGQKKFERKSTKINIYADLHC